MLRSLTVKVRPNCLIETPKWCMLGKHTRRYASEQEPNLEPIVMSTDVFDGPKLDVTQPPLITMHGLFGSKQNWRGISKALSQKTNRRIYTVDARNHGDSPHTTVHSSDSMSADVVAFMEARKLEKACLMGHSMGGRTMMYFALKYPQLTDRLIVVDISPIAVPRSTNEMVRIFDAMINMTVSPSVSMSEGRKLVREQIKQATDSNETVDFIMLNLRKDPQTGVFSWACNAQLLRDFLPKFQKYGSKLSGLPPYTGPTTFICGTHSPYMKRDHWPQILELFPNASIHWLETGHLVHFEQPQQFLSIVGDFINQP
ncbi:sn-1-specific diacylglycerol lipase ABHD11 isoform X1 [Drosophila tropicalis]|uniref:sn-1-specific diacylglycerol lipase ABHD11 isoform X1 n=1 Tax=Drosophila tropicalis TaxID=46794 RepID=UPI0035ABBAA2